MTEGYRVRPIFLMAQVDSVGYMSVVERESEEYKDVLQWDFMEDHHNLSLKERCFLEWLHFKMPHVAYVFKGMWPTSRCYCAANVSRFKK